MPMLHSANHTEGSDSSLQPTSQPRLAFTVYGVPAPQGSKRHVGNGVMVESSAKVKPWRADVREAARQALEATPSWDAAQLERLLLQVTFTLPRPLDHYRTVGGKRSHLLHTWAPSYVAKKPDLDKLVRSTCDALTSAGAYTDDSRVTQIVATKVYTTTAARPLGALDHPGARIVLTGVQ